MESCTACNEIDTIHDLTNTALRDVIHGVFLCEVLVAQFLSVYGRLTAHIHVSHARQDVGKMEGDIHVEIAPEQLPHVGLAGASHQIRTFFDHYVIRLALRHKTVLEMRREIRAVPLDAIAIDTVPEFRVRRTRCVTKLY